MTAETYTCAACHGVFEKAWTDEKAEAEYAAMTPQYIADGAGVEAREIVCDDCFQQICGQFGLTPP